MKLVKHIILLSRRRFTVKASETNISVPTHAEILSSSRLTPSNVTDHDLELSQEIIKCLEYSQVFDTKHTLDRRKKAVNDIELLLQNWITETSQKANQTNSKAGKLITCGSFRFGVNTRKADIDTVAIAPSHITSTKFFGAFQKKLRQKGIVLQILPRAYVPIINFEYETIKFDILFCRLKDSSVGQNLKLNETFYTKCYDVHSIRSINSIRAADEIIDMLPNYENFVVTLKSVKLWAMGKSLHKINLAEKNIRGITWTIMVAYVCKLFPNAPPAVLVAKFFELFSSWNWNQHVTLIPVNKDACILPSGAFAKRNLPSAITIWSPGYYHQNTTYDVRDILMEKFKSALTNGQESFREVLKGNLTCANFFGTESTCLDNALLKDTPLQTPYYYSSKLEDALLVQEPANKNRTNRKKSKNGTESMVESKHKPTSFYSQHSWKSDQICVDDFSSPCDIRKTLLSHPLILLLALAPSRKERIPLFHLITNMIHHFPLQNTRMAATGRRKRSKYSGVYKLSSEQLACLNVPHTCSDSYYWLFKIPNSTQNDIDSFQQRAQLFANHVENIAKEEGWLESNMLLRAITIANVSREEMEYIEETRAIKALPTRVCLEPTIGKYGDLVRAQKPVNPTAQFV